MRRRTNYSVNDNDYFSGIRSISDIPSDTKSDAPPPLLRIPVGRSKASDYGVKPLVEPTSKHMYPINKTEVPLNVSSEIKSPEVPLNVSSEIKIPDVLPNATKTKISPRDTDEVPLNVSSEMPESKEKSNANKDIKEESIVVNKMESEKPDLNDVTVEAEKSYPKAPPNRDEHDNEVQVSNDSDEQEQSNEKIVISEDSMRETQSQLILSRRNLDIPNKCDIGSVIEFPALTIDDINTSLKVVGSLIPGRKLKVINNTHLADDTSYVPSVTRFSAGQGRDKIFGYLEHMYSELVRNINLILLEIRTNVNVNKNVGILRGIICKLAVFLHKYENMRKAYESDSSMYARLGNNRDKFHIFLDDFFRDVTVAK